MPAPTYPRDMKAPALAPKSALGPADKRTLEIAAEILRERTMSLDPEEDHLPTKRLVLTVIAVTVLAVAALLFFRAEVRGFLGLG